MTDNVPLVVMAVLAAIGIVALIELQIRENDTHDNRPVCDGCRQPIDGPPMTDDPETFWLPERARRHWHNDECVQASAERENSQ